MIVAVSELVEDDPGLVEGAFEEGLGPAEPGHCRDVRGFVAVADEPASMVVGDAECIVFEPEGRSLLHDSNRRGGNI